MKIGYRGAIVLSTVLAVVVGCASGGGREQSAGVRAIEIAPPEASASAPKSYPPQCNAQCRQGWDEATPAEREAYLFRQIDVLDEEIAFQTRRADGAASAASAASAKCSAKKRPVAVKQKVATCNLAAPTSPAPTAPAASQPTPAIVPSSAPVTSAPAIKLADPMPEQRASTIKSYDWMWDRFGYTGGFLVYRPYYGPNKSVFMTQQLHEFAYECPRLRVPETDHALRVKVLAAVNPSLLWETDYHRLVAIYGAIARPNGDKNVISAEDVILGSKTYIGQHQEVLCRIASTKSLVDLVRDPSIGAAEELNRFFRRDASSAFDVLVQTTTVELPKDLLRALALKGLIK